IELCKRPWEEENGRPHGNRQEADRSTAHRLQEARGYHRRKWSAQGADQGDSGTSACGRDDRSSGLREARPGGPPPWELAQREKQKNLEGRVWRIGVGDSARPQGHVRSK